MSLSSLFSSSMSYFSIFVFLSCPLGYTPFQFLYPRILSSMQHRSYFSYFHSPIPIVIPMIKVLCAPFFFFCSSKSQTSCRQENPPPQLMICKVHHFPKERAKLQWSFSLQTVSLCNPQFPIAEQVSIFVSITSARSYFTSLFL